MLGIRLAKSADIAALQQLDTALPDGRERSDDIARWVADGECHIAVRDGVPVGYVAFNRRFFHQCFVELLMVAEGERRRGIGAMLLRHCRLLAGKHKLFTSTNTSNVPMQALLARLGFVPSGRLDNLDEGDPELFFVHLPPA